MDSNAHSEIFGPDTNQRGELLEDFLFTNALTVHNEITIPTFEVIRNNKIISSYIDVTISNGLNIQNWTVDPTFNGSDHNTIKFNLKFDTQDEPQFHRNWDKCNWNHFKRSLDKETWYIPKIINEKKLDKLVSNMYEKLNYAINLACPLVPSTKSTADKSDWFASELKAQEKLVARKYQLFKNNPNTSNSIIYKKEHALFKKNIRKAKNKAWNKFITKTDDTKKMAFLSKIMQKKENNKLASLIKPDGNLSQPGLDTLKVLTDTHFPTATEVKHVKYSSKNNVSSLIVQHSFKKWINPQLVTAALSKFQKKKSPGPDQIQPFLFEHLTDKFIDHLTFIYKCAIYLHYTPILWKETKVIFIPKPGKDDYSISKNFRPISLSNYFLKALERLSTWKMDLALDVFPIHRSQHGFSKGKSTESAVSNTVNFIEKFIFHNEQCLGIFLDISSAFDTISIEHIKTSLLKHGGDIDMVEWYYNYLRHRNLQFTLQNENKTLTTQLGFPQGGVCSAKFWLIAFDPAVKLINNLFVQGVGYADDLCALIGGRDTQFMVSQMNKVLRKLVSWGRTCNLNFNEKKTIAIMFSKSNKIPKIKPIMNGKKIEYSLSTKYLGVILDSKLHWEEHILSKINKAKRFLMMTALLTKNAFGPNPQYMRWAYTAIVRPMIAYGALCWAHSISTENIKKKLTRLNRMGMNTYARFPRSSPTQAVEILTDTMPLPLFLAKEALSTRIRLKHLLDLDWSGTNNGVRLPSSHLKHWNNLIFDCNLEPLLQQSDLIMRPIFVRKFQINTDSFQNPQKYLSHNDYSVYTDGSKTKNKVGAGFYIITPSKNTFSQCFRLPNYATVFQAEIFAIKEAAKSLVSGIRKSKIKIFIDSQAAILALAKDTVTSQIVADTINALNILCSTMSQVELLWTKAHIGTDGNEKADEMAKKGTTLPKPADVATPKAEIRRRIDDEIREIWHYQWDQYSEARQSKQFISKPNKTKAKYIYKLNRQKLGRFIRIITGHNNLNYHRSVIDPSQKNKCRFCQQEKETFYHFLHECPTFNSKRREIFLDNMPSNDQSWSVDDLLRFSAIPPINDALGARFDAEQFLQDEETLRPPTSEVADHETSRSSMDRLADDCNETENSTLIITSSEYISPEQEDTERFILDQII